MNFIDLLDDEYITLMSKFLDRLDEKSCSDLESKCEKYLLLKDKADKLAQNNRIIYDFFEFENLSKSSYSKEEVQGLKEYIEYQRKIDDYERLELYKTGIRDCIIFLKIINIL